MEYLHITLSERYRIMICLQEGYKVSQIACQLGRHETSIRREIGRNEQPYDAQAAQERADQLKRAPKKRKLDPGPLQEEVDRRLRSFHSPEQIAGRLKIDYANRAFHVSHETIYQYIQRAAAEGTDYTPFLRMGIRKRRYGYRGKCKYKRIRNGRSIDERPASVEDREEFGHFESDSVRGSLRSSQSIATHLERKTRFLIAALLSDRSADTYNRQTCLAFAKNMPLDVKTLTVDNGMEFSKHCQMEEALNAQVFFAHPYHSWERGANENVNGLLRQFFPKRTDLSDATPRQLQEAVDLLNNRPRKCLGYRTPAEALQDEIRALRS